MNILDAVFHVAHDHHGGVVALAARMGVSQNVLNKKVDPRQDTHHLRLDEAVKMGLIADDKRILQAHAQAHNCVVVDLPELPDSGDMALLDGFMDIINELGDFTRAFQEAYRDGTISAPEIKDISNEAADVQTRLAAFVLRLQEMAGEWWPTNLTLPATANR